MGKYDILKWYIWYSGGDPPPKKKNFHAYKQFGRSLGGSSVSNTLGSFLPPVIWASTKKWPSAVCRLSCPNKKQRTDLVTNGSIWLHHCSLVLSTGNLRMWGNLFCLRGLLPTCVCTCAEQPLFLIRGFHPSVGTATAGNHLGYVEKMLCTSWNLCNLGCAVNLTKLNPPFL